MLRSLRARIALAYVSLIVATVAALGFVLIRTEEQRFRDSLDQRLLAEARLSSEAATPALVAGAGIATIDPLAKRAGAESGARVTFIAPDGTVLGDSETDPYLLDNHGGRPEVVEALRSGVGRSSRRSATEPRNVTYLAVPIRAGGELLGVARVSRPGSAVDVDLRRIGTSVTVAATVGALIAATLAVVIAGAVTRPLGRLRQAASALAGGAFGSSVPRSGEAEVSDLANAFNEMAERLRETVLSLGEERSRLEASLSSSADGLIAVDGSSVVRYANPAAVSLFGEAMGHSFAEVARNHELADLLSAALAAGRQASRTVHMAGSGTWLQATVSPISHGGGWAALVSVHDITDVRRAETIRRDFVANVSHELRTPLAGIKAVVETLRDGALQDPVAAEEFLERVDAEIDRLVQLVEELLQLASSESGTAMSITDVSPRELLQSVVQRFSHQAERSGVSLTLDASEALPLIRADAGRLGQAAGNLIHNALKFTPSGGQVTVTATLASGALSIAVNDNGIGIDTPDLPRIFERFYVTDRARSGRGTGLGLAIVKHVVLAHGGSVDVRSVPGRGSTFTIALPLPGTNRGPSVA